MNRVTPLTGTDEARLAVLEGLLLLDNEIHTVRDQGRVFYYSSDLGQIFVGPNVSHGRVAGEAAMLALTHAGSPGGSVRSVHPRDDCFRVDTNSFWRCISNRGETLADWEEWTVSPTESVDVIDGRSFGSTVNDSIDGGAFGDALVDSVDGSAGL